jgi:aminopeptidase YwaD
MFPKPSTLMEDIRCLSEAIGPRSSGTASGQRAAQMIQAAFASAGFTVSLQEFPAVDWDPGELTLTAAESRLLAAANTFSPGCDLAEVPYTAAGTLAELRAADLAGKVVVLHGALTAQWIPAGYAVYVQETPEILRILEEKHPAAVITVNPQPGALAPLIVDWQIEIPSVTVPAEAGHALLAAAEKSLSLKMTAHRSASQAANVVAVRPGVRSERLFFCAHYDSAWGAPGAMDNASGVATLLALARDFAAQAPEMGIEMVAMAGEENHGVGNGEYMRRCADSLGSLAAVINIDGVGHRLGTNTATLLGGTPETQAALRETLADFPGMQWVEPWYESDHSSFAMRGVPAIAISSTGHAKVLHTSQDTLDWLSAEKLEEAFRFVCQLARRLIQ